MWARRHRPHLARRVATASAAVPALSSEDVRQRFVQYFTDRQHVHVPRSSLVPLGDPSLLFTNAGTSRRCAATRPPPSQGTSPIVRRRPSGPSRVRPGMVQFKDYFLGAPAPFDAAVSVQRCMRAGGKHNDLDHVGYTPRHHTYFEMLGNFSFGRYFKEQAIDYGWEFLTRELRLPSERLRVTYVSAASPCRGRGPAGAIPWSDPCWARFLWQSACCDQMRAANPRAGGARDGLCPRTQCSAR